MNTSSLRRRYLETFAGPGTLEASERGRAGYSFGRRYLASLLGVRLVPHPPSVTDGHSDAEMEGSGSHRGSDVVGATSYIDTFSDEAVALGRWWAAREWVTEDHGYRASAACRAAGATYRQLDYWARTGLVMPSLRAISDSAGEMQLYSRRDILILKVVKRLLDTGISMQQIRAAVLHLRNRELSDLDQVTLMSDGENVYECTSPDEVVELLRGGQGVFGIALDRVRREVDSGLELYGNVPSPQGGNETEEMQESGSAERREQAEELLVGLPETVSRMTHLPRKEHEALVTLLADLPTTISGLAEFPRVVRSAEASEDERNTS